ncbi:MAG: molecular chaperone DnaK [Bacteroidetes bacterium]|nr:MAG: molecular chaperone DnaK [Bacteroidota bacterium]
MSNTINYGIDLGTTNSVIARYNAGKVEIYKNPVGHKETLPSVVAFRKERIIVGDKAREYLEKDPENVAGSFKRKMGTTESFFFKSIGEFKTPQELSAIVLKELKNFVYTGEKVNAAVITIPASFDTIQSNATKKAGYDAGFEEVLLLQEPIAASLAYANKDDQQEDSEGQWLVYDLGGGTFDVALVKIGDGEMKVVDHQGDNFLGGLDFDNRIIDKIIIPHLEKTGRFDNPGQELKSAKGKYNRLYYQLLAKAEEAKVLLSAKDSIEIEFEIEDRNGESVEMVIVITKTDFENSIRDLVTSTIDMTRQIIERNNLDVSKLNHVLMIGGSTYMPIVRRMVGEAFGIPVNCNIDPTTAVAVGAAYYAGTRTRTRSSINLKKHDNAPGEAVPDNLQPAPVKIRVAYQKTSQDAQEYFTAAVEGNFQGLFYRITRDDGGFDSGLKALAARISEMLQLIRSTVNNFTFRIYDAQNNPMSCDVPPISIVQGKYNVLGQPLPNDICIEVDDYENNTTRLEVIFEKNSILPLKRTITKNITKTLRKGSTDSVMINIVEGQHTAHPSTNPSIGCIQVVGKDLNRDLLKGTDIEITLEMSESRDLRISTYLLMTDQEFTNLFSPSERQVNIDKLRDEIHDMMKRIAADTKDAERREDYELAQKLTMLGHEFEDLAAEINALSTDDITDRKYQLEDRKRKLAQRVDALTRDKHITEAMQEYFEYKEWCKDLIDAHGNPDEKKRYEELVAREKQVMSANSVIRVRDAVKDYSRLGGPIQWRIPEKLVGIFYWLATTRKDELRDQTKADRYIEMGDKAIERKNYEELRVVINNLVQLLPPDKQFIDMKGTGIG